MKIYLKNVEDLAKEMLTGAYNNIQNPEFSKEELRLCFENFLKNDMYFISISDVVGEVYLNQQSVLVYEYSKYEDTNVKTVKDMNATLIVEKVFVPLIIDYCYCSKTNHPWKVGLR